jgi:hypothetical protein
MNSDLLVTNNPSIGLTGWLVPAIAAIVIAVGAGTVIFVMINGPKMRAVIERERAAEVEEENRAFCTKFALTPGTNAFVACANGLSHIRLQHEERLNRDNF